MRVPNAKPDHEARCWGTQSVAGGGWLVDLDWHREVGSEQVLEAIKAEEASALKPESVAVAEEEA